MSEILTRAFFMEELPKLAADFAKEEGAENVHTFFLLRDGVTLRAEGQPVAAESHITFDMKSGTHKSRVVLPYSSIIGVSFSTVGEKSSIKGFINS